MIINETQLEQIRENIKEGGKLDKMLDAWYPEHKRNDDRDNKWYALPDDTMVIYVTNWRKSMAYGVNRAGTWHDEHDGFGFQGLREATYGEVSRMLNAEADKRGYIQGNYICFSSGEINDFDNLFNTFSKSDNELWLNSGKVFSNGIWAEKVKTITKQEAEKQLGKLIID